MLVSPTEPAELRGAGSTSSLPEKFGSDVLCMVHGGFVGVQRKEVWDLVSSLQDGRLAKELGQMQRLVLGVLVVEGHMRWTADGEMLDHRGFGQRFTKKQWRGALWSCALRGVSVAHTDNIGDTVGFLIDLEQWAGKDRHASLARRPNATAVWGKPTNREFGVHMLMGIPGVGPELADRIYDRFGLPWTWTISMDELTAVEGIGKRKAKAIWEAVAGAAREDRP